MPISVQLEPHETYLCAVVTGDFALAEAQEQSLRILQASVTQHLAQVLLDIRQLQGHPTVIERYEYSVFMAREAMAHSVQAGRPPMRLAYLGREPLLDPYRFGMLVARNRGLLVLVTEDADEALRWLGVKT